jgi:hypothetical protein
MTRQARIAKLEAKHGGADTGPTVIFLCDATTGEPGAGIILGHGTFVRHARETVLGFKQRIAGLIREV